MNTTQEENCARKGVARRAKVGVAAAVGTVAAGLPVSGLVFAGEPDPTPEEAAGAVIQGLADDGESFISTYGLAAVGVAIGASFVITLVVKLARRVKGAF